MKNFKEFLLEYAKKTYKYYVLGNGKGYLKVTVAEVKKLGIEKKISSFSSYDLDRTHIFLDDTRSVKKTDMEKFLEALGEEVNIVRIEVFPYRMFGHRFGAGLGFLPFIANWHGNKDTTHTGKTEDDDSEKEEKDDTSTSSADITSGDSIQVCGDVTAGAEGGMGDAGGGE